MFEEFFRFSGQPFKLNPDPKFFFGSRSHNKAMAYLHYGLRQAEGFIVITGDIGAGKSIMIGHLIDQLDRTNVVAAHILTPNLKPENLLTHILSAFRIEPAHAGAAAEIEAFEDFLFDQMNRGRRVLLIVDEAQNLPKATLEELRILSNLDYDGTPLFQVFLVGQPEFKEILAASDMEQLRQRVIASYHLSPLAEDETRQYIEHRLRLVGWENDPAIDDESFAAIHAATGGVPRKINKLCNRVLLACAIDKRHAIAPKDVRKVLRDLVSEDHAAGWEVGDTLNKLDDGPDTPSAAADVVDASPARVEVEQTTVVAPSAPELRAVGPATPLRVIADNDHPAQEASAPPPVRTAESIEMLKNASKPKQSPGDAMLKKPQPEESGSVFDRLRAQRKSRSAHLVAAETGAPSPATISDVANAIAAASTADDHRLDANVEDVADLGDENFEISDGDNRHIGQAVSARITDIRSDLKAAHANVAKIRRRLRDYERRRHESRASVAASLDRAESILGEIKNIWR